MAKTRLCERCKAEIPAERLEAVPGTRLCVRCSQATGGDTTIRAADDLAERLLDPTHAQLEVVIPDQDGQLVRTPPLRERIEDRLER